MLGLREGATENTTVVSALLSELIGRGLDFSIPRLYILDSGKALPAAEMAAISTIEYGDPATQKEMLDRLSPIYKLDRIKAATMVQHGANDTNVPVIEAEQIVKTLKDRGVPVEYILFPDEGHGWRKVPNRVKSTTALVDFFRRTLVDPR